MNQTNYNTNSDERGNRAEFCPKCGRVIRRIRRRFRTICVDDPEVWIAVEDGGRQYVRYDGSKVPGREVGLDYGGRSEPAFRIHECREERDG